MEIITENMMKNFRKYYDLSNIKLRGAIGESLEDVLRNAMNIGV